MIIRAINKRGASGAEAIAKLIWCLRTSAHFAATRLTGPSKGARARTKERRVLQRTQVYGASSHISHYLLQYANARHTCIDTYRHTLVDDETSSCSGDGIVIC